MTKRIERVTARTIEAEASRRSRSFLARETFIFSSDYNSPWNPSLEISNSQKCNISFSSRNHLRHVVISQYGSRILSHARPFCTAVNTAKLMARIHFRCQVQQNAAVFSSLHQTGARAHIPNNGLTLLLHALRKMLFPFTNILLFLRFLLACAFLQHHYDLLSDFNFELIGGAHARIACYNRPAGACLSL